VNAQVEGLALAFLVLAPFGVRRASG
jgi:hypothetical protein